jgi:hypothetical protein
MGPALADGLKPTPKTRATTIRPEARHAVPLKLASQEAPTAVRVLTVAVLVQVTVRKP